MTTTRTSRWSALLSGVLLPSLPGVAAVVLAVVAVVGSRVRVGSPAPGPLSIARIGLLLLMIAPAMVALYRQTPVDFGLLLAAASGALLLSFPGLRIDRRFGRAILIGLLVLLVLAGATMMDRSSGWLPMNGGTVSARLLQPDLLTSSQEGVAFYAWRAVGMEEQLTMRLPFSLACEPGEREQEELTVRVWKQSLDIPFNRAPSQAVGASCGWSDSAYAFELPPEYRGETVGVYLIVPQSFVEHERVLLARPPRGVSGSRVRVSLSQTVRADVLGRHPNAVGHGAVTSALLVTAFTGGGTALAATVSALTVAVLSGSRAATAVALLLAAYLAVKLVLDRVSLESIKRRRLLVVSLITVLLAAFAASALLDTSRLRITSSPNQVSRGEIWLGAAQAYIASPVFGGGDINDFVDTTGRSPAVISHAHNFLLELANEYGLLGLVAAVLILTSVLWSAVLRGTATAVSVVIGLLLLLAVDFAAIAAGSLFALALLVGFWCDYVRGLDEHDRWEPGADGKSGRLIR